MVRSALLATLVVGAVSAQGNAQAPPTPPDHYALTNARIVVAAGNVIESGTVVVRDGRITAVGPQVDVPATAIRLDLSGMTVYPGLIDAASSIGLPTVSPAGGGFGPGASGAAPAEPMEVLPARLAADVFDPASSAVEAARNAGVTTVGLAFDGGIFPGRTAAVHTGSTGGHVLRAPVAQQVLLGRRRGEYPGTLMGSIAFVRQAFYDAQYEVRARDAWERQPSGPRPSYSADHRALEDAVTGELPVWYHASAERDIGRVIDLAADVGTGSFVLVGVQEGWRAVDRLREAGQPVIVSVDWPRADQITGRAFELRVASAGEDEAAEQADSAAARQARGNAAALARAGVTIALSSYGLDSPSALRERVRATVDAGLSPDAALTALTVTPARLLGIEDAVGTIEAGKLANLVVTDGDIFGDSRVHHVFVEGVRYDVPAPAARPAGARAAGGAAGTVPGEYVGEIDGPAGLMEFALSITASGNALSGSLMSEMGGVDLQGEQNGSEFTLRGTAAPPGMTAMAISLTGSVSGDDLRGTLTIQGMSAITFTARRRTPGAMHREASR